MRNSLQKEDIELPETRLGRISSMFKKIKNVSARYHDIIYDPYWFKTPASVPKAQERLVRPYFLKESLPPRTLQWWDSQEYFYKYSPAYEIFFKLYRLVMKIWILLLTVTLASEALGYTYCYYYITDAEQLSIKPLESATLQCGSFPYVAIVKAFVMLVVIIIVTINVTAEKKAIFEKFGEEYQDYKTTEKKFCLIIRKLPDEFFEKELIEWVESLIPGEISVLGALRLRSIDNVRKQVKKIKRLMREKKTNYVARNSGAGANLDALLLDREKKIEFEIAEIEKDLLNFHPSEQEFALFKKTNFERSAIICFENADMTRAIKKNFIKRPFCNKRLREKLTFKNANVEFDTLPAPELVEWKYVGIPKLTRYILAGIVITCIIILMGVALYFVILGYIEEVHAETFWHLVLYVTAIAAIKQFVNIAIVLASHYWFFFPDKNQNEKLKFDLMLLLHYLAFNIAQSIRIFGDYELVGLTYLISTTCLIGLNMLTPIYDLVIFWHKQRQRRYLLSNPTTNTYTQAEADSAFQNPEFDFFERVNDIGQALFIGFTLYGVFPMVVPMCFFNILLSYFVDKYLIINLYAIPKVQSYQLALKSWKIFMFNFVMMLLGFIHYLGSTLANLLMYLEYLSADKTIDFGNLTPKEIQKMHDYRLGITLILFFILTPILIIYYSCCYQSSRKYNKLQESSNENMDNRFTYENASKHFYSTYLATYPYRPTSDPYF